MRYKNEVEDMISIKQLDRLHKNEGKIIEVMNKPKHIHYANQGFLIKTLGKSMK